jgi:hypothetical protein
MYTLSNDSDHDNINDIQNFISLYSPDILLLYEELKRLYHYSSPFFLNKLQYYHLIDLFTQQLFEQPILQKSTSLRFINFYNTELHFSYNLVQGFFKKHFKHNLDVKDWDYFCYILTDLYEIRD